MTDAAADRREQRVLVLAPIGRDAELIAAMLRGESVTCCACRDLDQLARELGTGAGAILLTEEAFAEHDDRLAALIAKQPPWSDLPILLLTGIGADSPIVAAALRVLGNVTLLERPVRMTALATAVRSALRARSRQYETRAHLLERQSADERKNEFLATLAHELRNPLAPIRNSLQILRMTRPEDAEAPVFAIMERQLNQMVRLVDDLMEVSRITHGKIELRTTGVDLASVIATAVETSRPLIDGGRHCLTVALPPEPLWVEADSTRLAQVFSNVLNNAAKYTDPGGRISIVAQRSGGTAIVTISDTGIGMDASTVSRVFDMFAQADVRRGEAKTGLGIGLSLARSLVEMHGGHIRAHSDGIGKGSRFVVELPLSNAEHADAVAHASAEHPRQRQRRVLVVDDNRDAADTLSALLQLLGAEVRVVYDGQTALTTIERFHPNVVVLDIGMPDMDGYEVARRIREREDSDATTLIALTGWGQEKDRRRSAAVGFDDHLIKPVDFEAVRAVLGRVR